MTQNIDRVAKRSRVLLLTDPVLSVTNLEPRALGARRFNTVTDLGECACLLCRAKSKRLCDATNTLRSSVATLCPIRSVAGIFQ